MSRLLIDTNILLDLAAPDRPGKTDVEQLIRLCNGGGDMAMVCPMSLKDVYYIMSKAYGEPTARSWIEKLTKLVVIAPVSAEECLKALYDGEPDYEDGIVRATAELEDAHFIITRDKAAYRDSHVRAIDAGEYLAIASRRDEVLKRRMLAR